MKTKHLILSLMAVASLASCSNEDAPQQPVVETAGKFVAVNIKNPSASRAEGATYEDGLDAENKVSSAVFFFFDAAGQAYDVTGAGQNFQTPSLNFNAGTTENVEEISDVVVVIDGKKQVPPASMVVVLNAPQSLLATQSLASLQSNVLTALKNGENFIMSNSVYLNDANSEVVVATELVPENICTTEDEAKLNPVDVYVERVAAKVRVNTPTTNMAVKDADGNAMKDAEGKEIYAKIVGWQVTNTVSETNLLKQINAAWTTTDLGFNWNDAPYFRSYWATTDADLDPKHSHTWTALAAHNPAYDYYFENTVPNTLADNGVDANNAAGNNLPQLLVAVEFVDAAGAQLSIAKWYGEYYTLESLKTAYANTAAAIIYVKNGDNTASSITPADLDFVQVAPTAVDNRYLCYPVVAAASESKSFCDANGNAMTLAEVNAYLAKLNPAQIWGEGGYYYLNIKHLGAEGKTGEFGMVRNHIYDITIDGVVGLGTPVYNPNDIITPEKPDDTDQATYVAARINILSWRVVSQNSTLQ